MRNPTLTTYAPQIALAALTVFGLIALPLSGNRALDALCWLLIATLVAAVGSYFHDRLSGRFKPWKVYVLLDKHADVIYVGSTNHCARRFEEHLEDDVPWKQQVRFMACVRCCWTEKQARRIEERRIKALTAGVEKNRVKVLHNEVHARPADNVAARFWRSLWLAAYRIEAVLFPDIRWIDNPSVRRHTPINAPAAEAEPDAHQPDPEPVDDLDGWVEATYERRPADCPDTDYRAAVPLLALSPVPMSPCPPGPTPVGGDHGTGDKGDMHRTSQGTLSERIRAAHQRHTEKTSPTAKRPTAEPGLTAEQRAAKRTWDEREKKRKQRAKASGHSYTKQPWPGEIPT